MVAFCSEVEMGSDEQAVSRSKRQIYRIKASAFEEVTIDYINR